MANVRDAHVSRASFHIQLDLEAINDCSAPETSDLDCSHWTASLPSGSDATLELFSKAGLGPRDRGGLAGKDKDETAGDAACAQKGRPDTQESALDVWCLERHGMR